MAIIVKDSFEPLSEQSLRPDVEVPLLVESEATRVLRQDLRRYCEGQITGRSFLIAGHRGAGKSTLVAKAFLDVWMESERQQSFLRPLFIALHGPSLFPRPEVVPDPPAEADAPPAAADDEADDKSKAAKPDAGTAAKRASSEPRSDARNALEQITLGLHRAVTKEFAKRYYDRVTDLVQLRQLDASGAFRALGGDGTVQAIDRLLRSLVPDVELYQIAAQFETELYEAPAPPRLLDFWRRVDAVSGGVLFGTGYSPSRRPPYSSPLPPGMRVDLPAVHEQGARELVALAGVVDAYRRISGEYTRSDLQKDALQQQRQRNFSAGGELKNIVAPVSALLTGGVAGAGIAASGASAAGALIGAIVAALAASMVLKVSTERKRDRTFTREYQFVFDLSVATLDRVLPILIERLRLAGLAPVFVIDELDKVKGLGTRMLTMVHHLKKLVAENAFFCFLTDRSYYEEMVAGGAQRAYPVEYTYFTQRLFVVFSPEDFEQYLRLRIPDPAATSPTPAAPTGPAAAAEAVITSERTACAIVRWALRHRSQLHVLDLQREISALRDDNGNVTIDPKVLASSLRNCIDATFQVAIELTLAQPKVQELAERPEFRRLLNDAMYYVTREWIKGRDALDLTPGIGYPRFVEYLEQRAEREDQTAHEPAVDLPTTTMWKRKSRIPQFSAKDCAFLFGQVQLLADFLSDRPSPDVPAPSMPASAPPATPPDWRRLLITEWNTFRAHRNLPDLEASVYDALLVGEPWSILVRDSRANTYKFRDRLAWRAHAIESPAVPAPPPAPVPPPPRSPDRALAPVAAPAPEPVAQAVPAPPAPPEPGPPAPSPMSADIVDQLAPPETEAWRPQAEFVTQFALAVKEMQVAPIVDASSVIALDGGAMVSLASLQSRFCVISQTPAWEIVEKALARLEDSTRSGVKHASYREDMFHVTKMYDVLSRNAGVVGGALACAAAVGEPSGLTEPQQRIEAGLAIISQAYAFADRDEAGVRTALENLVVQMGAELGIALSVGLMSQVIRTVRELQSFTKSVRQAMREINDPAPARGGRLKADVEGAWLDVQRRLSRWVETGDPGDPEIRELMAGAAAQGPSTVMSYDPRRMSAADWTRLLATVRAPAPKPPPGGLVPSWIGLFAVHALGFGGLRHDQREELLKWLGVSTVDYALFEAARNTVLLLREGKLLGGPMPDATLIAIRRTVSPFFTALATPAATPQNDIAMLVGTAEQMRFLLVPSPGHARPMHWLATGGNVAVAVEMEPESNKVLEIELYPKIQQALPGSLIVHVYTEERSRDILRPNVVRPREVRDIVQAAVKGQTPLPKKPEGSP